MDAASVIPHVDTNAMSFEEITSLAPSMAPVDVIALHCNVAMTLNNVVDVFFAYGVNTGILVPSGDGIHQYGIEHERGFIAFDAIDVDSIAYDSGQLDIHLK